MAAKAGGGSTAITAHSVVGEWTHVSNRDLNKGTLYYSLLLETNVLSIHCSYSNQRGG